MPQRLSFYINRPSPLHRLNPFTKLTLVFTLIILAFLAPVYWMPTGLFLFVITPLCFWGRIQKDFFNAVARLLLPVVGFLFVMQSIFQPVGENIIFGVWVLTVTDESLRFAYQTATRIMVMVSAFILFLLSTHPGDLMSDLTRRGLPGTFAYVITSTLQIIPQMQAKANTIIDAQRARGLETQGSIRNRVGALLPLVGPLVFGSIVEVEERAIAIEARGFTAKRKKTSLRELEDKSIEIVFRWFCLVTILVTIGFNLWLS